AVSLLGEPGTQLPGKGGGGLSIGDSDPWEGWSTTAKPSSQSSASVPCKVIDWAVFTGVETLTFEATGARSTGPPLVIVNESLKLPVEWTNWALSCVAETVY